MATSGLVSFARHSHKHIDFSRSTPELLEKDIAKNRECIQQICSRAGLIDCIAYPFGKTPKERIDIMDKDLRYAFIVDNRVAELDFAYPKILAISRIHIDSQDNIVRYKWKLSSKYRSVSVLSRSIRGILVKGETQ
jgi:peptidoglycan/xylan/chitin deacetylase (PgdA/CDA1 family)